MVDRRRLALALAAALLVAPTSGSAADPEPAGWAPILAAHPLRTLDGAPLRLADLAGEVVVVNFWASWCKPCRRELKELDGWTAGLAPRGGRVVAVSVDSDRRKAVRFVEQAGLSLPVCHDGPDGLAATLDLPSLPMTVVLDRSGRVAATLGAADEAALGRLRARVDALLAEPAPDAAPRRDATAVGGGRRG